MTLKIAGFGRIDVKNGDYNVIEILCFLKYFLFLAKKAEWLQCGEVKEVPIEACRATYAQVYKGRIIGLPGGIKEELICAKSQKIHQDACQGDSGSALQFFRNDKFHVVGVTSFGLSCNTILPSFYTRVYSYLDWIEAIVWL